MLILFDIDATLLTTQGVGMRSMVEAGKSLFGEKFHAEGVSFAGRLDPLLIREMFELAGVPHTRENLAAFRAEYLARIREALKKPGAGGALPGVMPLLERLRHDHADITLGLLTGNFEETGSLKLQACGIDPQWFAVRVWGDQSPHDPPRREHLPAVGFGTFRTLHGREVSRERVTIVGDTPHDVSAALENGCRCLGVATGAFNVAQLRAAGAHHAVENLTKTDEVIGWLTNPSV